MRAPAWLARLMRRLQGPRRARFGATRREVDWVQSMTAREARRGANQGRR